MGISNGELANETNFNKSFLDKNTDTETVNKIALRRPTSGADVEDAQQAINDNKDGIASNDTDIAQNASDIAQNASDIATNTGDIATNATNISTNAGNIATNQSEIQAIEDDYGVANGLATLDGGGKVPASQLPETLLEYLGTWDADTNTPTLSDATGSTGNVYLVNVAGTQDLGSGPITFDVGDWAIHNGSVWQKSLNSNAVVSVFGRVGAVVAQSGDYNADQVDETATRYFDVKNNRNASVDPTVNDDSTSNYVVGSTWFNSTDSKTFICQDNTAGSAVWVEFSGGGSGVGGKDIYALFDAEDEDVTGFTNITTSGTSPLNQSFSYLVNSYPASCPVVTLQKRNKAKTNGALIQYTMTSGTAKLLVKDNSSNILGELEISSSADSQSVLVPYFVSASTTTVQLSIEDISSATGLKIDDITFTDEPYKSVEVLVQELIQYQGATNRDGSGFIQYGTEITNTKAGLFDVTNSGHTRYTCLQDNTPFSATVGYNGGINNYEIRHYNSSNTLLRTSQTFAGGASGEQPNILQGLAQKGDYIVVETDTNQPSNNNFNHFTIKAESNNNAIISPSSPDDVIIKGQNNGGTSITGLVTPIDFTETGDTHDAWDGNTFTAPYTGIYNYSGVIAITASLNTIFFAYKSTDGGSSYLQVPESLSGFTNIAKDFHHFNGSIELSKGDKFQIRCNSSLTLSSDNLHVLTISRSSVKRDVLSVVEQATALVNGEEYETNERWFGKKVYARSWEVFVNTTTGAVDHLLATTVTGLDVIKYDFIGLESTFWRSLQHGATNAFLARFRYNTSNGQITVRTDGVAFTQERFTLYYTK